MFKRASSPATTWTPDFLAYLHQTGSLIAEMHTLTRNRDFASLDEGTRFDAIGTLILAPTVIVQVSFDYKGSTSPGVMAFSNAMNGGKLIVSVNLPHSALLEVRKAFEWSAMSRQPHVEIAFQISGDDHAQRTGVMVRSFSVSSMIQLSRPKA